MIHRFGSTVIAMVVASTALLLGGSAANAVTADGCLSSVRSHGEWIGKPSDELSAAADALQGVADDSPDAISAVAFCRDYSAVEVLVKRAHPAVVADIKKVASRFAGANVLIRTVDHSLNDLIVAAETAAEVAEDAELSVNGYGPDPLHDGVQISIAPEGKANRVKTEEIFKPVYKSEVPSRLRVRVRFDFVKSSNQAATRRADVSPFKMSAEINGAAGACSLGVPIRLNGNEMVLTAGHCGGSAFSNSGRYVGSQYTTAYPGNANRYGDWKLLDGANYRTRVFNGDLASSSTLPIEGGAWGSRPLGSTSCTSGRTTAQICRYVVKNTDMHEYIEGVARGPMMELVHGSTASPDDNGFERGDSGGPCYYADGDGVRVSGIVTGWIRWKFWEAKSFYCSQLKGVRAWNSSVVIG